MVGGKNSYFVLDPWTGAAPLSIFSHEDSNTVSIGTTVVELDNNELLSLPPGQVLDPGTEIVSVGAIDLGSAQDGTDMPVQTAFQGLEFVVPQIRGHHTYELLSPVGNAKVEISIGAMTSTLNLTEGQVTPFYAGFKQWSSRRRSFESPDICLPSRAIWAGQWVQVRCLSCSAGRQRVMGSAIQSIICRSGSGQHNRQCVH